MASDVPRFDTQQEAARLGDAGFHQEQADAIVGTVRRAVVNLATKEDLHEAVAGLKISVEARHQSTDDRARGRDPQGPDRW